MNANPIEEILAAWADVKCDRAFCDEQLRNTGPGESPWSNEQNTLMSYRSERLAKLVLNNMGKIEECLTLLKKFAVTKNWWTSGSGATAWRNNQECPADLAGEALGLLEKEQEQVD